MVSIALLYCKYLFCDISVRKQHITIDIYRMEKHLLIRHHQLDTRCSIKNILFWKTVIIRSNFYCIYLVISVTSIYYILNDNTFNSQHLTGTAKVKQSCSFSLPLSCDAYHRYNLYTLVLLIFVRLTYSVFCN